MYLLQNQSVISSNEIYVNMNRNVKSAYNELRHVIRNEEFSYVPPFKVGLMSLGIKPQLFAEIAKAAKKSGEYDVVIVDTDHVFDESKAEMLDIADKVIIVTKQNKSSIFATNVLVSNVNGIKKEKYIFVCNLFDKNEMNYFGNSDIGINFAIDEYVEVIDRCEQMKGIELGDALGIKKVSFLLE